VFYAFRREASTAWFDASEKRHAIDALRHAAGDAIEFTDGLGKLYSGRIEQVSKDGFSCTACEELKAEPKPRFHLAVSAVKNHDRIEWMLEKCCEIGLASIVFPVCKRSERSRIQTDRLQRIAVSAIKQSGNLWLPEFHGLKPFQESLVLGRSLAAHRFIAHCMDGPKAQAAPSDEPVFVLIGPEGDFTAEEVNEACALGYEPLQLGDTRLRTETAALAACVLFNIR
jgi:16S rRNA (uracil1498-N3)-methyltransferase